MITKGEPNLRTLEQYIQYGILADLEYMTGDWEIGNQALNEWILDHDESELDQVTLIAKLVFRLIGDDDSQKKVFEVTINVKEVN